MFTSIFENPRTGQSAEEIFCAAEEIRVARTVHNLDNPTEEERILAHALGVQLG